MRMKNKIASFFALFAAGSCCVLVAYLCVGVIERASEEKVRNHLVLQGFDWADVHSDGMRIVLEGEASSELEKLAVQRVAADMVASDRLVNTITIFQEEHPVVPEFSIEILRNASHVTLLGLVPAGWDKEAFISFLETEIDGLTLTDFLEQAQYPLPETWEAVIGFSQEAISQAEISKLSASPETISLRSVATTQEEQAQIETQLKGIEIANVEVILDLTAIRPVVTPYIFEANAIDGHITVENCFVETSGDHEKITLQAEEFGIEGFQCEIGLGAPSSLWVETITLLLRELGELENGRIQVINNDVTLEGVDGQDIKPFNKALKALEADLAADFYVTAIEPQPIVVEADEEGAPFVHVVLPEEGAIVVEGVFANDRVQSIAQTVVKASSLARDVQMQTSIRDDLPQDWTSRTLASLGALGFLEFGELRLTEGAIDVSGFSGKQDVESDVKAFLKANLPAAESASVDIAYLERLDPLLNIPTPQECVNGANAILSQQKFVFAPGSSELDVASFDILDQIAEGFKGCQGIEIEIGGHTDSQGREVMNLNLSKSRANSVLDGLLARRVVDVQLSSKGYGETQPIADNGTAEGREENRRIEFKLITPEENGDASEAQ